MVSFTHTFGDIEYDVSINGGDVFIETVYTDLGINLEDLYFIPQRKPLTSKGELNYISFEQHLCDVAYEAFLDEWGSEIACNRDTYGDMKYNEDR